jgi:hypothetical protein
MASAASSSKILFECRWNQGRASHNLRTDMSTIGITSFESRYEDDGFRRVGMIVPSRGESSESGRWWRQAVARPCTDFLI